jgi:hypothetical protein
MDADEEATGRMVVWSTSPEQAKAAMDADEEATGRMLSDASDYVLGCMQVAGPKGSFPLCARHATSYVLPNLAQFTRWRDRAPISDCRMQRNSQPLLRKRCMRDYTREIGQCCGATSALARGQTRQCSTS